MCLCSPSHFCRISIVVANKILAVRQKIAVVKDAMNANPFLPHPIRFGQASNSGTPVGSTPNHEITRRSFLKRTGGATVATLMAWNLASHVEAISMIGTASAKPEDWGSRILICYQDPRLSDASNFAYEVVNDKSYKYSEKDPKAWEKIPQIDCTIGMDPANDGGVITDCWGQTVKYSLLHWLEFNEVVVQGHYVRANSYYKSTITSWAAVIEGRWIYRPYSGTMPVDGSIRITRNGGFTSEIWARTHLLYRVVLLASLKLGGVVRGLSPDPLVDVQSGGEEYRPWLPIMFADSPYENSQREVGYLQLSNSFEKSVTPQLGGQKFRSIATIIPTTTLKDQTKGVQNTRSMSIEMAEAVLKVGASATQTNSMQERYETNYPPKIIEHHLVWGHKTMKTDGEMDVSPSDLLSLPNPVKLIPQLAMIAWDGDNDDKNDVFNRFKPIESANIDQAINTGVWTLKS